MGIAGVSLCLEDSPICEALQNTLDTGHLLGLPDQALSIPSLDDSTVIFLSEAAFLNPYQFFGFLWSRIHNIALETGT